MRNSLLSLICLLFIWTSQAQPIDINRIQIANLSGEIADILKTELKLKQVFVPPSAEVRRILADSTYRAKYTFNYEVQLTSTYLTILPKEFILEADKTRLQEFGDDALNRFKTISGGKYIDQLTAPILSGGIQSYLKDTVDVFFKSNSIQIKKLTTVIFSVLNGNHIDATKLSDEELNQKINELLPTSLNILSDRVTDELVKEGIYLKSHRAEIVLTQVRDIEGSFKQPVRELQTRLNAAATTVFRNLGKSIQTLADNEGKVNDNIVIIQADIQNRLSKINSLEAEMSTIARQGGAAINNLAAKQIEHAELVAQNLLQTDIINVYLKQGLKMIGQVDAFKDKAAKIFSGDYLNDFKAKLEVFKTPTLTGVVNFASTTIGTLDQISGSMQQLGILKGGAAQTVGKFVKYANLAIGIATALMPPNPIGIIGALGSLGGLFGGGGPSIEEQMFQAMQDGFNQINQRLDQIEEKIDRLSDFVQKMYKDLMQSLQLISNQLTLIEEKVDLGNQMQNFQIYADYNLVEQMINNKIKSDDHGFDFYRRWYNTSTSNNVKALQALDVFISSPQNLKKVIREDFTALGETSSFSKLAAHEIDAYKKTLALVKSIYPGIETNNKIKNLLSLPAQKNAFNTVIDGLSLVPDKPLYNFESTTENYYNPYFISRIAGQYIELHPFFIFYKLNDNTYTPISDIREFITMQTTIGDRLTPALTNLRYLLEFVNFSLIQQSILSGHSIIPNINNALFGDGSGSAETIEALKANELLEKNVSTFMINHKIDKEDLPKFSALYYSVATDRTKLNDMNALLKYGNGKLKFGFNEKDNTDPLLYLNFINPVSGDVIVRMPLAELSFIEDQRMIYNDAFYALLKAKESIMNSMIDIGFLKNISTDQAEIYKNLLLMKSPN